MPRAHWLSPGKHYYYYYHRLTDRRQCVTDMKIRFYVDQGECFRKGINQAESRATIDVDPAKLDEKSRKLIGDRLDGINVKSLWCDALSEIDPNGFTEETREITSARFRAQSWMGPKDDHPMIKAKLPTLQSLMEAIEQDETNMKEFPPEDLKREVQS